MLELQIKANNIMEVIWNIGLFPSIKYILSKDGFETGVCIKPFGQLSEDEMAEIDVVLRNNLYS